MAVIPMLVARDDSSSTMTPTMTNLLIALVVLFAAIAILVATLLVLRHMRRTRKEQEQRAQEALPMYSEKPSTSAALKRNSHLSIRTSTYGEKDSLMMDSPGSPAGSSVPEIRITFPEEVDASGKRMSGRVVVVKVGDHSVGLEPVHDHEQLPPYQQSDSRFQSLDLDRMGGLKEKDMR